MLENNTNII